MKGSFGQGASWIPAQEISIHFTCTLAANYVCVRLSDCSSVAISDSGAFTFLARLPFLEPLSPPITQEVI